ncbi:hypothetical protein N1F89_17610, partial [Aquibium sp. A9E412]|uniref:hypothetical protein n=1 Tax=Aquibium sp. A9E412 TaxID=2976767 RepID=UPI0025B0AD37
RFTESQIGSNSLFSRVSERRTGFHFAWKRYRSVPGEAASGSPSATRRNGPSAPICGAAIGSTASAARREKNLPAARRTL